MWIASAGILYVRHLSIQQYYPIGFFCSPIVAILLLLQFSYVFCVLLLLFLLCSQRIKQNAYNTFVENPTNRIDFDMNAFKA